MKMKLLGRINSPWAQKLPDYKSGRANGVHSLKPELIRICNPNVPGM